MFCYQMLHNKPPPKFPGGSDDKESACNIGDSGDIGLILGQEDPLEKGIATHNSP